MQVDVRQTNHVDLALIEPGINPDNHLSFHAGDVEIVGLAKFVECLHVFPLFILSRNACALLRS
jgi:hypothetical protein